jgi:hypothetical protein
MSKIFCLIWLDLFNFSPQATPFALVPLGAAFGDEVMGGLWEGYGRDEKNPSRAQTLYTSAFPAIMGGMRDFSACLAKKKD